MQKFFLSIAFCSVVYAQSLADLPQAAREILRPYLHEEYVVMSRHDGYCVRFANGLEMEFWREGTLKSVRNAAAMASFVPRVVLAVVHKAAPKSQIRDVYVLWNVYRIVLDSEKVLIVDDMGRLLDVSENQP